MSRTFKVITLKIFGRIYQFCGYYPDFICKMLDSEVPKSSDEESVSIGRGLIQLTYGFYAPLKGPWLHRKLRIPWK
jgi:hypothetical protein